MDKDKIEYAQFRNKKNMEEFYKGMVQVWKKISKKTSKDEWVEIHNAFDNKG